MFKMSPIFLASVLLAFKACEIEGPTVYELVDLATQGLTAIEIYNKLRNPIYTLLVITLSSAYKE